MKFTLKVTAIGDISEASVVDTTSGLAFLFRASQDTTTTEAMKEMLIVTEAKVVAVVTDSSIPIIMIKYFSHFVVKIKRKILWYNFIFF